MKTGLRPAPNKESALDRPVFFVYSSSEGAVAAAEEVREGWPDIPVEVIEETWRPLSMSIPDEFNRLLEEFLEMLPEE